MFQGEDIKARGAMLLGSMHLVKLAADSMKQQRLLVNNPRPVGEADALAIYRSAW